MIVRALGEVILRLWLESVGAVPGDCSAQPSALIWGETLGEVPSVPREPKGPGQGPELGPHSATLSFSPKE